MKSLHATLTAAWELPLLLFLAAIPRFWAAQDSLWLDELHTAWCVQDGWSDVAPRAELGNTNPLYFRFCWLITRAAGLNEWTLRAPSLAAGLLAIAVIYGVMRRWTSDRWIAAAIALAAALDSNFIRYAAEARAYALVQLVALVHTCMFVTRMRHNQSWLGRATFVLFGALLVYLHYTAILILVGQFGAALLLLFTRKISTRTAASYFCDVLLMGLLSLGLLPHAMQVFARRSQWLLIVDAESITWQSLIGVLHGGWYVLPVIAVQTGYRLWHKKEKLRDGNATDVVSLVCVWLVPVMIAGYLTKSRTAPLLLTRYLIGASTAPLLLAGINVNYMPRLRTGLLLLVVAVGASTSAHFTKQQFVHQEDWRRLARQLGSAQPAPILLDAGLMESDQLNKNSDPRFYDYCRLPLLTFYAPDSIRPNVYPLRFSKEPRIVVPALERALERSDTAWFVLRSSFQNARTVARRILKEPALREFKVDSWQSFGRLQAVRLERVKVGSPTRPLP